LCSDPHLDISRLPGPWAEVLLHVGEDFRAGVSMVGNPAIAMV
jgi:hypothetical protein